MSYRLLSVVSLFICFPHTCQCKFGKLNLHWYDHRKLWYLSALVQIVSQARAASNFYILLVYNLSCRK